MSGEKTFVEALRTNFFRRHRKGQWTRIENNFGLGIPDIACCDDIHWWWEAKATERAPLRDGKLDIKWTREQGQWGMQHLAAGGNYACLILIRRALFPIYLLHPALQPRVASEPWRDIISSVGPDGMKTFENYDTLFDYLWIKEEVPF